MPSPDDLTEPEARLLGDLSGHFARTDPVPPGVLEAAYAAIELRDLEAQLAQLLRDTALEAEAELAGVRGLTATRSLTFGLRDERYVEVDVETAGELRVLTGYVVPASGGTVAVEHTAGAAREGSIDDGGRFAVEGVPGGPVRLRISVDGAATIVTEWLTL